MASIVYNGRDFSPICTAMVTGRSLNAMSVEAMRVSLLSRSTYAPDVCATPWLTIAG